eukprot:g34200.t1
MKKEKLSKQMRSGEDSYSVTILSGKFTKWTVSSFFCVVGGSPIQVGSFMPHAVTCYQGMSLSPHIWNSGVLSGLKQGYYKVKIYVAIIEPKLDVTEQ